MTMVIAVMNHVILLKHVKVNESCLKIKNLQKPGFILEYFHVFIQILNT